MFVHWIHRVQRFHRNQLIYCGNLLSLMREVRWGVCARCDREHTHLTLSEDKRTIGQSHSKESRSFNCVQNSGRSHTVLNFLGFQSWTWTSAHNNCQREEKSILIFAVIVFFVINLTRWVVICLHSILFCFIYFWHHSGGGGRTNYVT